MPPFWNWDQIWQWNPSRGRGRGAAASWFTSARPQTSFLLPQCFQVGGGGLPQEKYTAVKRFVVKVSIAPITKQGIILERAFLFWKSICWQNMNSSNFFSSNLHTKLLKFWDILSVSLSLVLCFVFWVEDLGKWHLYGKWQDKNLVSKSKQNMKPRH